ncbi:hypothetical protein V8E54_000454 [Elaphomyces granulatus]
MSSESTEIKLIKQEDWPAWFDFIRSEATTAKIWRFVDPGEKTVPRNVEPDLYYYTRSRDNTDTPSSTTETHTLTPGPTQPTLTPLSTQPQQPIDPKLEQYLATQDPAGRWNTYKVRLAQYEKDEKNLGVLSKLIRTTVGPKFKEYLFNEHDPRKLLQILQRVAKPSKAALRQLLEADLERLEIGPKRLGVESWLNLYVKILTKGKRIDDPPREATEKYLIRHLVQLCETINPSIFAAYSLQAEEGELTLTLEELINKFNITYRPPKVRRAAFPTLAGEPMDDATGRSQNKKRPINNAFNSYQRTRECSACKGLHDVKTCFNLFEEIRPDGWVISELHERRCQQYLKTTEGRTMYEKQRRHYAANPPVRATLKPATNKKRKVTHDPQSPQLSAAAVYMPPSPGTFAPVEPLSRPSAALNMEDPDNIKLSTSWMYDTGTNAHVGNDIKHFQNYFDVQPTHMATGSSSSAIHGYGDVMLTIQCGTRSRNFTLKNVAYCPGFHTNLVCADILFDAGVKIDQESNCLVYRQTGGLFADLPMQ